MKLSELAFETIKSVVLYDNSREFSLLNFREYCYSLTTNSGSDTEGISINQDYKRNADNVFIALNRAFQRLANFDKLHPIQKRSVVSQDNELDFSEFIPSVSYILNLINAYGANVPFRNVGLDKIFILENYRDKILLVEYYPEMPSFTFSDIAYHKGDNSEEIVDNDIDLRKEYGINNMTCEYLKLYAKSVLLKDIDPSESSAILNQAESYMLDLEDYGGEVTHFQRNLKDIINV